MFQKITGNKILFSFLFWQGEAGISDGSSQMILSHCNFQYFLIFIEGYCWFFPFTGQIPCDRAGIVKVQKGVPKHLLLSLVCGAIEAVTWPGCYYKN